MLKSSARYALAVCAAVALAQSPARSSQTRTIPSGAASPRAGVFVSFTTVLSDGSDGSRLELASAILVETKKIHRYFTESKDRLYLGYDLTVEPGASSDRCTVLVSPLSIRPEPRPPAVAAAAGAAGGSGANMATDASYREQLLANYPGPQAVIKTGTISVDLVARPSGQKAVDHIQVSCTSPNL